MSRISKSVLPVVIFLSLILIGCKDELPEVPGERFNLIVTPDGRLLRLDTVSGEVLALTESGLVTIPIDGVTQLVAGRIYIFENGMKMKYLGAGKFEPAEVQTLDEYLQKQSEQKGSP